jgi:hypothetical protein
MSNICDDIFKSYKGLDLKLFVLLINRLFGVDYDINCCVEFLNTEPIHYGKGNDGSGKGNDGSGKELFDLVIKISEFVSHLEFQTSVDDEIVSRVFEYGYRFAFRDRIVSDGVLELEFPRSKVICFFFDSFKNKVLRVIFSDGFRHELELEVFTIFDADLDDMFGKGLALLAPFHLVKWKRAVVDGVVEKVKDEILRTIDGLEECCERMGVGSYLAESLLLVVSDLYEYLCRDREEFKEVTRMISGRDWLPHETREKKFRKHGRKQRDLKIAEKLLDHGDDIEGICKVTGLFGMI